MRPFYPPLSLPQLLADGQPHPTSCFLQPPGSPWYNPPVRPRNDHTQHLWRAHHRCVHERRSNADLWDEWHGEGEGSRMGDVHRPDSADTAQSTCHFVDLPSFVSQFHGVFGCKWLKHFSHDTATDNTHSPTSIRAPCPIYSPCPCSPRRARYPGAPVHITFVRRRNTVGRDHVVILTGGIARDRSWFLRDGFYAKAWSETWEGDLSDSRNNSDGETSGQELYAALVHDPGPKVRSFPLLLPYSRTLIFSIMQHRTRGAPIATCAASSPLPPMPSVAPVAGLVGPLGSSSFSLQTVVRAQQSWRAEVRYHAWHPRETRGRTNVVYPQERAKPDAEQGLGR
jgi:hypothetical protein